MRFKTVGPILMVVLAFAVVAAAQPMKVTGTLQCGKPEAQHAIPAGDDPSHVFSISKVACNWTKAMEIAGTQSKQGASTGFDEIKGATAKGYGQHVSTTATGEKTFVRYEGSATMKDGAPQAAEGTWSYTGGTGKLRDQGKGTYKESQPGRNRHLRGRGDYELPSRSQVTPRQLGTRHRRAMNGAVCRPT
jgi:hypothetical protein